MSAPIQMTASQYQAKYGSPPPVSGQGSGPVQMTTAQYQAKYGSAPNIPHQNQNTNDTGFIDPGSPESQQANSNDNPLTFATNLTNALGLKGTTDTFGSDIAAALNPQAVKAVFCKFLRQNKNGRCFTPNGRDCRDSFYRP